MSGRITDSYNILKLTMVSYSFDHLTVYKIEGCIKSVAH